MAMGKAALYGGTPVRCGHSPEWPRATREDIDAVVEALESGSWCRIGGDRACRFETEFAAYQGARFGVAVNSGTSALKLGLLALGIRPGDEVIMSNYTFMASPSSMLCPTTEHLCRDETVWLSGTFMLEAGREGMEQVGEAIEKIRENRHELISRARATE